MTRRSRMGLPARTHRPVFRGFPARFGAVFGEFPAGFSRRPKAAQPPSPAVTGAAYTLRGRTRARVGN